MKKIFLTFVLALTTLFTNVYAEDNPRAVIIFDASGSMWGQINGVTKLEIARDALKNVVKEWNPKVELGLTVYGHRTKGDCNDIETVIPVGKVDKNRMIKTVMSIKPKGKTPISRSLRKVADELKYTEEKATIILISDGKETCDPDPCGAAKELAKQGIDFVTHVIGFNVDKKTSQQLECIASATGGEYFLAKNASALNKAMKVIVKKVEKVKVKPIVKELEYTVETSGSEKEGGKWIAVNNYIYTDDNGKIGERVGGASSRKKTVGHAKIPVGKYILKSSYNDFEKLTPFEVKAGEVTKIHVIFGQFIIEAKCATMSDKISYEVYASSGQLVYDKQTTCSKKLKITLNSGDYSVEAKVGELLKEVKFTVGGDVSKLTVDMTDIKTEASKEELIKADTADEEVVTTKPITIGNKKIEIKGITQKDADKLKELGAILGAFSGMIQEKTPKEKKKQSVENDKADKEFDEMSKELDMFTK